MFWREKGKLYFGGGDMDVIVIITFVVGLICKILKHNAEKTNEATKKGVTYEMPRQVTRTQPARVQVQKETPMSAEEVSEKIARTKQRILESRKEDYRERAQNTTILERAKANAEEDKVDVTLETMEAEHNHSERVSAAVHHHPEDIIPENVLGNIEDLMIKGYDGNLCFERDFVGEGLDMVSRFVVPSDIPDSSQNNLA